MAPAVATIDIGNCALRSRRYRCKRRRVNVSVGDFARKPSVDRVFGVSQRSFRTQAFFIGLVLPIAVTACSNRCPTGTTPAGLAAPAGTAQWCEASAQPAQAPSTSPEATEAAEVTEATEATEGVNWPGLPPATDGRALQGPMTTWTAGGELQSHGEFIIDANGVSHADGLWTFWHANGHVRSRGHFAGGLPVGCVSRWDEDGTAHTGRWNSEQLVYEDVPCKGPTKTGLRELESELEDERTDTVKFDLALSTLVIGGGFGIRNDGYVVGNPNMTSNVEFALRRHVGKLRLGAVVAQRWSDDGDHDGWLAAATTAYPIPSFHEKVNLEGSVALGVQRTFANLKLREDPDFESVNPLVFFGLYAALELQAVVPIHRNVAFVLSTRAEGGIPTDWETNTILQRGTEEPIQSVENWEIGRYSVGLGLGLRVLLY